MTELDEKFLVRAKREDNGKWIEGFYCRTPSLTLDNVRVPCIIEIDRIVFHDIIPETLGHCIGLKDKNGKRIFEGDIIRFEDFSNTENGAWERSCVGVVCWDTETASFQVTGRLSAESWEVLSECETIGNIHDNSELLES